MICRITDTLKKLVEAALDPALGLTIPNHTHPSGILSKLNDVPENIQVFRTITTLLAQLQHMVPFKPTDNLEKKEWRSSQTPRELRISDAFAQLAVSQHNVVAVSTIPGWDLSLIACADQHTTHSNGSMDRSEAQSTILVNKVVDFVSKCWNFIFTRNDREADPATFSREAYPIIITPEEPKDLGNRTAKEYMKSLETAWIQPSLPTHLWILTTVLMESSRKSEDLKLRIQLSEDLFKYTAAMSCQRIKRRITDLHSRPFLKSLQKVKDVPIPSVSLQVSKLSEDKEEAANDNLFLKFISASDKLKADGIPILIASVTNLLNLAELDPPSSPTYNDKTCNEFHQVLLELLDRFEAAVDRLCVLLNPGDQLEALPSQLVNTLTDAQVYGYALLRMARGQAFRLHIQNIGPLLINHFHASAAEDDEWLGEPKEGELEDSKLKDEAARDENLKDKDLKDISDKELTTLLCNVLLLDKGKRGSQKLTKSYVHWLQLIVAHFNAVEIIVKYVMSSKFRHHGITVKCLVAPKASVDLYDWRKLLVHSEYFPTRDPTLVGTVASLSESTNTEILDFLEKATTEATRARDSLAAARRASTMWKDQPHNAKTIQLCRQHIKNVVDLGNKTNDAEITKQFMEPLLSELKLSPKEIDSAKVTKGITDLLMVLTKRFSSLMGPGTSGKFYCSLERLNFRGTLHCEASLASLINSVDKPSLLGSEYSNVLSQLQDYRHVIGVSKRCCPVCYHFLALLTEDGQEPFITRGSHSIITPCTLPPWTPSPVVDSMIKTFGTILRRDLIALKDRESFSAPTTTSGSDTPSIDNTELDGERLKQDIHRSVQKGKVQF
ncbi:hypothetical protein GALMADRAFT_231839 [Galerina marginata CBS 339.88]|uniref:Uncharacterized protein n=1 Tax=Galerina marginata (strain CBS 339.88) TaxID=685588 RepID=A0A067SIV5_GALM3|nr:hypothetical protein GALMADRAFT_231839 [Galerina marginata CBS 339.88]